jgi:hypothetical protein
MAQKRSACKRARGLRASALFLPEPGVKRTCFVENRSVLPRRAFARRDTLLPRAQEISSRHARRPDPKHLRRLPDWNSCAHAGPGGVAYSQQSLALLP